jgi:hypothetical protein
MSNNFTPNSPQIGGPSMKSIRPWIIIRNAFNVNFLSIHISMVPRALKLDAKQTCTLSCLFLQSKIFNFNDHELVGSSVKGAYPNVISIINEQIF